MAEGYQVIARRWRPQQFDEIVGQEHIVRTLKNAIETNRIGHAYLFVGPRGTGKTTTARIFAKALNCTNGPKVAPPLDDPICQAIVAGACMDVIEIDAATNRSIDDAKTIRDECQYAPAQCQFKIFIIDEVHQLTKEAFNALLKTLEEPPPHIKFIFATTEADKVLPTITSRCQRFEFQAISEKQIAERLTLIAKTDGIEATPDALLTIARLAKGGMRDSQSILDQAISFCGKNITADDVANIYGIASIEEIKALFQAMSAADYKTVVAISDKFFADGRDLVRIHQDIQTRVREALRATIQNPAAPAFSDGDAVPPLTTEQYLRMLETLQAGEYSLKNGLSERANFEVTLLKAVEQSRSRAIDTLIKQVAGLAASLPQEAGEKKIGIPPPADSGENDGGDTRLPAGNPHGAAAIGGLSMPPLPRRDPPPPLAIPRPANAPRTSTWNIPTAPRSPLLGGHDAGGEVEPDASPGVRSVSAQPQAQASEDVPPLEAIQGGDEFDPDFVEGCDTPPPAPLSRVATPPAHPGDPDFDAALAATPDFLRKCLADIYHAEFVALLSPPKGASPSATPAGHTSPSQFPASDLGDPGH
ncbi:MAG: DNA polymerase III subunit gamma/tau [Puniceicoccales bacterium]|jgi:DNA polymerase-3 subunit gamma/tau|nr:DNA polymerase III subunit gamma/tau [Puniceicoccales bacterium]